MSILFTIGKWAGFRISINNHEAIFRIVIGWFSMVIFNCDMDYCIGMMSRNKFWKIMKGMKYEDLKENE